MTPRIKIEQVPENYEKSDFADFIEVLQKETQFKMINNNIQLGGSVHKLHFFKNEKKFYLKIIALLGDISIYISDKEFK